MREAFLHCAQALRRSRLWDDDYRVERKTLPTLGRMLTDQIETDLTEQEAEARVQDSLRNRLDRARRNRPEAARRIRGVRAASFMRLRWRRMQ